MSDELRNEQEIEVCEQEEVVTEEAAQEQEVTETPEEPAKKGGKKWLIAVIAAVVVVALAVGAFLLFRKPKQAEEVPVTNQSVFPEGSVQTFPAQNGEVLTYNGKVVLESAGKIDVTGNVDGKAMACETEEGLYLVTEQSAVKIAEGQDDYGRIRVAPDGAAVAYEDRSSLYLYNSETEETLKVTDWEEWYAISPNGKYAVYLSNEGLYRWNGETEKLDENDNKYEYYLSISDSGMVYVFGRGGEVKGAQAFGASEAVAYALYCFNEEGECSIVKDGWTGNQPLYNKRQNQIIFAASSDGTDCNLYISENGQPAVKLLKDTNDSFGVYPALGMLHNSIIWSKTGYVCNMEDFRGQIFDGHVRNDKGETALFYVNEELEANVVLGYSRYSASMIYERDYDNGFIYAKYMGDNRALYSIDVATGEKEKLKENVNWFASAGKGVCYYSDDDGALYRMDGGESEKIAENIARGDYIGTDDGSVLYLDDAKTLWCASRDGELEKVDEQVKEFWCDGGGFYYVCGKNATETEVYFSADGQTFAQIEGVGYNLSSDW